MPQHLFAWQWGEPVRHLVWMLWDETKRTIISWSRKITKNFILDLLQWPKRLNTDFNQGSADRLHELQITPTQQSLPKSNKSQSRQSPVWTRLNRFKKMNHGRNETVFETGQYQDAIIMLLFFKINLNIQIYKSQKRKRILGPFTWLLFPSTSS